MAHDIYLTKAASRDLAGIPHNFLKKVDDAILALADTPRPQGTVKLKGADDLYRIRVGNYRILYTVDDKAPSVTIVRVGDRREVYRQL